MAQTTLSRWLPAALVLVVGAGCVKNSKPPNLYSGKRQIQYTQNAQIFTVKTNGLTVMVLPEANTDLVKVDVRYQVGAVEDPPGKAGLAHLVEHLLFEVQPRGADTPTLAHLLGATALYYNAYTTWDTTRYTSVAMAEDFGALLALEAQRMQATCDQIDDLLLQRELDLVRNELHQRDSAGWMLHLAVNARIYGEDHPYARSPGGLARSLDQIQRQDVCDFLNQYYSPRSAFLVVSGHITTDAVLPVLERLFGPIRARDVTPRRPMAPPVLRGTSSRHTLPVNQATAVIAFAAPPVTAKEALLPRLLLRLWRIELSALERKHSYIDDISMWQGGGERAPLAGVVVRVNDPGKLRAAVDAIFAARESLSDLINDETLQYLRSDLYADMLFAAEPFMRRSELFTDYLQHADHDGFLVHDLQALDLVTAKAVDLAESAQLLREHSHVAYIYPRKQTDSSAESDSPALDTGPSYHIPEWELAVDPREAEVTLPVAVGDVKKRAIERVLPNGLRVLLVPSLTYPVIDIRLVYPVGHLHDPVDRPGLAAMAAYVLAFKDEFPAEFTQSHAFSQFMVVWKMGGALGRDVDERSTTFRIAGLAMHADALLWKLYYLLDAGIYKGDRLKQVRRSLTEGQTQESRRDEQRTRAILGAIFGKDHPHAVQRLSAKSVAGISTKDLAAFRASHHGVRGATLIVTGNFDLALVNAEIDRLFGSWKGTQAPPPRTVPGATAQSAAYFALNNSDAKQIGVTVAFATEPGLQKRAARMVLREMVRGSLQSLRQSLGAAYSIDVEHLTRGGPGVFLISTRIDRRRAVESFMTIRRVLGELQTGDLKEAFVRARRSVLRDLLANTVHSRAVANELEFAAAHGLGLDYQDELARQVAALRPGDIRALIAAEMAPGREIVVVQGQKSATSAVYQAAGIRYRVLQ